MVSRAKTADYDRAEYIHNDYDSALGKVKSAMAIVHKRQAETMAVVKRTLEETKKGSPSK